MKYISDRFRPWAAAAVMVVAGLGLLGACNSHPVSFAAAENAISVIQDRSANSASAVDILWVIDNSGSMCEEQKALRDNFDDFITGISDKNIDFHIGVTTTDMKEDFAPEPVARPGYLQAIPQPVTSNIKTCHGEKDPEEPFEGRTDSSMDGYKPVRQSISVAVDCTKDPSKWDHLNGISDNEIGCYFDSSCKNFGNYEEMFPTTPAGEMPGPDTPAADNPYRNIPTVLRYKDYLQNGNFTSTSLDNLRSDFKCMSLVGTRGYSIEKGLDAAVTATSKEMTGGTVDNPTDEDAPNHGLLREGAKFSVIFVTDENDCTDDGTLPTSNACSGNVCAFANNPRFAENSPLIPSEKLAHDLVANLEASKSSEVSKASIVAASIHGRFSRYGQDYLSQQGQAPAPDEWETLCQSAPDPSIVENQTCDTSFGTAYSGDRYERFLRQFNPDQVFPEIPEGDSHMTGLMCQPGRIATTLKEIGNTIAGSVSQCIFRVPYECTADADCPAYQFGSGTPSCVRFGDKPSTKKYCTSGLQVRMSTTGDTTLADLKATNHCISESVGSKATPHGCVLKRNLYNLISCPGAESKAIDLAWAHKDKYFEHLAGYDVQLIYTLLPEGQNSPGGGGDAGGASDSN